VLEFDQTLRAKVKADFPSAIEWAALGLPGLPLLAPGRSAFVASGNALSDTVEFPLRLVCSSSPKAYQRTAR